MGELRSWNELPLGGVVVSGDGERLRTGGWRTGLRPEADVSKCIDCLLCWLYCPDAAIELDGTAFAGIDYDLCKGCEICVDRCPTGALTMVAEVDGYGR
jgi:2-oxoacid:acceptor oxidoreductase delta subunit (pyruvate/2-ketoisovalerate family)